MQCNKKQHIASRFFSKSVCHLQQCESQGKVLKQHGLIVSKTCLNASV